MVPSSDMIKENLSQYVAIPCRKSLASGGVELHNPNAGYGVDALLLSSASCSAFWTLWMVSSSSFLA